MSTAHAASHDDHAENHAHHVSSLPMLLGVFVVLIIMTVLTVYTAKYVELGFTGNFILAMTIATFKASLVCAFFMHLIHDNKFNSVILFYCLITLGLFILFTAIDLESRAAVDPRRAGQLYEPDMVEKHFDAEKAGAHGGSHSKDSGDH